MYLGMVRYMGEKSWYQFMFGITTIVMLFGSSLAANLAQ